MPYRVHVSIAAHTTKYAINGHYVVFKVKAEKHVAVAIVLYTEANSIVLNINGAVRKYPRALIYNSTIPIQNEFTGIWIFLTKDLIKVGTEEKAEPKYEFEIKRKRYQMDISEI